MKNNKGFTLIEILAVIVLLGMLMSIALVSLSKYVEKSKLNTYLTIAKEYMEIASIEIAKQELVVRDTNTVYYIHINNLEAEDDISKSPFGEWADAYVVVVIDFDTGDYHYYWTSVDEAGYRVDETINSELTVNSIYVSNDLTINPAYPIGGRDYITVYDKDGNKFSTEPEVELEEDEAEYCFTYIIEDTGIAITGYDTSCGTDVIIPSSIDGVDVYRIADSAFKNKGIRNLTIYKGTQVIGLSAFQGNNINTVKLAISVRTIGDYAFYKSRINNLIMSEGVQSIGSYAFAENNICDVKLPASLTSIGTYAFASNCLTYIDIPAGVTIGGGTFSGNDIAESSAFIYKKNSDGTADYSSIVGYAGNQSYNVKIPATKNGVALKRIESNAFASTGLDGHLDIPDTVTYIGPQAFAYNSIDSVDFPDGLMYIGGSAFRQNEITSLDLPDSLTYIGNSAFTVNKVKGEDAIVYGRDSNGPRYDVIVSYAGGREAGPVTIPAVKNGVTLKKINASAFKSCSITQINMPDISLTPDLTIEAGAFSSNAVVGDGAFIYSTVGGKIDYTNITDYAGKSSGNNGTIEFPRYAKDKNGNYILDSNGNKYELKIISVQLTWMSYKKIIIPEGVTSIARSAFGKYIRSANLVTIVNKSPTAFAWNLITDSSTSANNTFVTGTIIHEAGNIEVISG